MNINATLLVQFVVFFVLAGFTMKFIWPPFIKALDERAQKIADGLAAADKGQAQLKTMEQKMANEMQQAKTQIQQRIQESEKRAQQIIEAAKSTASAEAQRIMTQAQAEVALEMTRAKEKLREEVAALAIEGAQKILMAEVNANAHAQLLTQLKGRLA